MLGGVWYAEELSLIRDMHDREFCDVTFFPAKSVWSVLLLVSSGMYLRLGVGDFGLR